MWKSYFCKSLHVNFLIFFFFFFFQTDQLKENQKQSKEKASCTMKIMRDLEVSTKNSVYVDNFLVHY